MRNAIVKYKITPERKHYEKISDFFNSLKIHLDFKVKDLEMLLEV